MNRRQFNTSLLLSALSASALASGPYPDHPIRVVIPYAPGGGTDIIFRILTPYAARLLGQSVIVDNRPGAATIIGTTMVANAAPDGYTLLASDAAIYTNPGLFGPKLPFDTAHVFQAITMMAVAPVLLIVNPQVPARNLKELLALAKAEPGKLNYASGGVGSASQMGGELFKLSAGLDIKMIAYKGTGAAMIDLLGGQVQMMFSGISSAKEHVLAGRARAIAVTGTDRSPTLPDVPTFAENGLDVDASTYWGIYAPAKVPRTIVDALNRAFVAALHDPAIVRQLAELGYTPIANAPEAGTRQFEDLIRRWTGVVQKSGITADS
jgi:tripartite-type tricarboxylate transporter receptor subunit TctC